MIPELPPTPASHHVSRAEPKIHPKIHQALVRALPSRKDITILLEKVKRVSILCYQSNYMFDSLTGKEMPKEPISVTNLLYPDPHPVLLGRQMLLLAAALQCLSPNEVIPNLTKHHQVIMEELADSAIKMVTTNDVLLGTLEGLENIILEGFYHIDSGNIRRAWITMRRAVMAGQLLGIDRPGHYRFKVINVQNDLDPEVMWACIVSMECDLSLLLGLPTSTIIMRYSAQEETYAAGEDCNLLTLLVGVRAKIFERNKIHPSHQARDMTQEIDRELVKVTGQMPSTFWRPLNFAGLETDSVDAFFETRRSWAHMCYYTLLNQLHLPYMLCPSNSPQTVYNRIACVNASREILNREIAVRTFNPITACCRMGDFMALIAGMTLILAHIVSHHRKDMDNLLVHQRLGDRATVERALECMKSMSELRGDVLATKCAALLKDLLAVEADASQVQSPHGAHEQEGTNHDIEDDRNVLTITMPYAGAIRIAPAGITMTRSKISQDQSLHEGVIIGGIGSLRVNSPGSSDKSNGDSISYPTQAVHAPPSQQHGTNVAQVTSEYFHVQNDQMFPDAAASMDDWVFQGFDTAFFDVLMRGAGDQQLNVASTESWDF